MVTSIEVWADNLLAYQAFNAMGTQWRYRPSGMGLGPAVGLEYQSVPMALRMAGIPAEKEEEILPDLRIMEAAALEVLWSK